MNVIGKYGLFVHNRSGKWEINRLGRDSQPNKGYFMVSVYKTMDLAVKAAERLDKVPYVSLEVLSHMPLNDSVMTECRIAGTKKEILVDEYIHHEAYEVRARLVHVGTGLYQAIHLVTRYF